jgi:hypothetical protein
MAEQEAFWAKCAARALHWYLPEPSCWLNCCDDGEWHGWLSSCGSRTSMSFDASWAPWTRVVDAAEAPFVRWFCGALTNAAFNEVDRHLLSATPTPQPADAAALIPEPMDGHPEMAMSRQQLLLHSVLTAHALRDGLALPLDARIAVYMPNRPEVSACQPIPRTSSRKPIERAPSKQRRALLLLPNPAPTRTRPRAERSC